MPQVIMTITMRLLRLKEHHSAHIGRAAIRVIRTDEEMMMARLAFRY
jgi:hypothetical protein